MRMHDPPRPGEILREMWLAPLNLSITAAAENLKVSRKMLSEIVNGRASTTPEMATRLELAFARALRAGLDIRTPAIYGRCRGASLSLASKG